jgi:hypothetical protein
MKPRGAGCVVLGALFACAGQAWASGMQAGQGAAIKGKVDNEASPAITAAQLRALPERTLVLAGLRTMRVRVVSLDSEALQVFETLEGEGEGDWSLALLAGEGSDTIDPALLERIPRQDALAVLPAQAAPSPAGLWAYAPGRGTSALRRGAEASNRERKRLESAMLASRLAELEQQIARMQAGADDEDENPANAAQTAPAREPSLLVGTLLLSDGQLLSGTLLHREQASNAVGDAGGKQTDPANQADAATQADAANQADPANAADSIRWLDAFAQEPGSQRARGSEGLVVPLDAVRRIDLSEDAPPATGDASTQAGDTLALRNGDVLRGFVGSVWDGGELFFTLEPAEGASVRVPAPRVAQVRIAEPASPAVPGAGEARLWLGEQTLRVQNVSMQGESASFAWVGIGQGDDASQAPVTLNAGRIRAIALAPARIAALAEQRIVSTQCADGRRWCPGAIVGPVLQTALGAADIELPGPMDVTFALPSGASTFAASVELPESSRELASCEFVVLAQGEAGAAKELARVTLGGDPEAVQAGGESMPRYSGDVVLQLPAGSTRLTLRLQPGPDGPALDRVLVRRALLAMDAGQPRK